MEHEVVGDATAINFGAVGVEEILQNVRTILTTPEFSCPMNRDFAWTPALDDPMPIAQARIAARVTEAIREYEPRAEVVEIKFDSDPQNGQLRPIVKVRLSADAAI